MSQGGAGFVGKLTDCIEELLGFIREMTCFIGEYTFLLENLQGLLKN